MFVKLDGSGTACMRANPCALQIALNQACDGDIIYLAQGTHTGAGSAVITLTKFVILYGGWGGAASGAQRRRPTCYPSVLNGEWMRWVIAIIRNITPR